MVQGVSAATLGGEGLRTFNEPITFAPISRLLDGARVIIAH